MNEGNNNQTTQTPVTPVAPTPTQATPVASTQGIPVAPTQATPVAPTQGTPVAPTQAAPIVDDQPVVTPNSEVQVVEAVVNTTKKSSGSSFLFIVVMIIVVAFVIFIDEVVDFFTNDMNGFFTDSSLVDDSSNLFDGYIKLEEQNSYMKVEKVKFYNFKKGDGTSIILNFVSDKSVSKPEQLEVYLELYSPEKVLLYKEIFNPKTAIDKDAVSTYSMSTPNDVYQSSMYAKALVYSKSDKETAKKLTCTSSVKNDDVDVRYSVVYNFLNNELNTYDVTKQFTAVGESNDATKYRNELKNEYKLVNDAKISTSYEDNYLKYSVDFSKPEYTPLYEKGTIPNAISTKEKLKGWTCE